MSEPVQLLLVDDEARNLDALEAILEDPGYRLLRAQSADEALRCMLAHDVAAIVLDVKMPDVSGFELAHLIKGTKRFKQVPILFLSAYHLDQAEVITGYGAGAIDVLTKPVNPHILRHKIATFVDLFEKTRAFAELNRTLEQRVRERTEELERSQVALERGVRQKEQFLATLAHELRNPLAPLRTGLDVLLEQFGDGSAHHSTLTVMDRQLSHMVRLINDLLDLARISQGTLEMRPEPTDVSAALRLAEETVAPWFQRRAQHLVKGGESSLIATVDGARVSQIVGNLLHNASKHSPEGATVRLDLQRAGDNLVVSVVDPGVGLTADQLERAFEMHSRQDRSIHGGNDGIGIGLALSRQLATLHGGSLTASSAGEGLGATFELTLPLGDGSTLDPGAAPASTPTRALRSLRVVVVEDNEDSADMMAIWIERLGHVVRVARTGSDGLALVTETQPDVVLSDIGLPDFDGVTLCQRILAEMRVPPIMVALSGWGGATDLRETAAAGFHRHLVKPVEMRELRDLLQEIAATLAPDR